MSVNATLSLLILSEVADRPDYVTAHMDKQHLSFSHFYDRYSPVLYSIAMEITGSKLLAEEILIATFLKIRAYQILHPKDPDIFFRLISLMICTTREILDENNFRGNFSMQRFYHMPILSKLLFKQASMEELCETMKMDRGAIGKMVRREMKGMGKV